MNWVSVEDGVPDVGVGRSWRGFVSNGKQVFRAELFVSSYSGITEETVLAWRTLEMDVVGYIPYAWVTHWANGPVPPILGRPATAALSVEWMVERCRWVERRVTRFLSANSEVLKVIDYSGLICAKEYLNEVILSEVKGK